ncbi:MAG: hypothetical protein RIR34_1034, partial [Actinomycetota bacterium]
MPEPTQREVYFAEYEEFLRLRNAANNGIMALGVGASLSAHFLQLSSGSKNTLKEIFPGVSNIDNFNLKPDRALKELRDADPLLASMAVPYHLGLFESFCGTVIGLLRFVRANQTGMKSVHKITKDVEQYLLQPLPASNGRVLDMLKSLRNDLLHQDGRAKHDYFDKYSEAIEQCLEHWKLRPGGNIPHLAKGQRIELRRGDLLLTLGVVKGQAKAINFALQESLPREAWVKLLVRDYLALGHQQLLNDEQHLRRCAGFARSK